MEPAAGGARQAAAAPAGIAHEPMSCAEPQQQPQQQQQDEDDEQQCHICMEHMAEAAAVQGCGHRFHYACLRRWVGSRTQPVCPVCRTDVKALVLPDGSEEVAQPATSAPAEDVELDLSCLDHSYFLAEVNRLLSRANSVHNRAYRDAYGCGRRGGSRQTQDCLEGCQEVLGSLSSYKDSLEGEVHFDPQVLLQELYRLDRQLTSLQAGGSHGDAAAAAAPDGSAGAGPTNGRQQQQQQRFTADDADHHHYPSSDGDDYGSHDDDYGDDALHAGLSWTPGRRPPQRHVVKHARSNSGQQQPQRTPGQQGQQPRQQQQGHGSGRKLR